ncbi:DUF5682 family protein [Saprospira sp. CCB-QB6]|uniref:DUF5682 family protein n=1 Tax=Saprospira sp. CCB-QB6 TaxID=3023936 RepID=UPI00234BCA3A|nr:DUF5682 family protein [Saprospira sp. CCB-QB6]WCL81595.1 DUF5682 family protein [Saprospira sp. CCB-QB6]
MDLQLLGIRHHGPGSARALAAFLESYQPELILLEGVEDADALLPYLDREDMQPPLAQLIYNPKNLQQAVYYPFAAFSPEWQAMRYAQAQNIPLWHFDLPQSIRFGLQTTDASALEQAAEQLEAPALENQSIDQDEIRKDPLGYMAKLAGYEDSERWWEVHFEQYDGEPAALFAQILSLMQELRKDMPHQPTANGIIEALREAYMRKTLRQAKRRQFKKVVVVCGAWHTPALDLSAFSEKADNALLRGLPKVKTAASWIPWSYERLSREAGYGAGIVSPAWYSLLFENREEAVLRWMSRAAQLFRAEGLSASPAQVIDAIRLAQTTAHLRGQMLPGIQELFEAAQTLFTQGEAEALALLRKRLIVGEAFGEVSADIPSLPLQEDIEGQIKSLKLKKYRQSSEALWLKATKSRPRGGLDLRNEFDREQSRFLHRLCLIGIPWGQEEAQTGREKSSRNEYWQLKWQADFALHIIEANTYGNTLLLAAEQMSLAKAKEMQRLEDLSSLLELVLKAHLPELMQQLLAEFQHRAALTKDVLMLMDALPPLVQVLRYGDVRQTDLSTLGQLVEQLLARVVVALPRAAAALDEEASAAFFKAIIKLHQAVVLLNEEEQLALWQSALLQLSEQKSLRANLQGLALRLLFDQKVLPLEQVAAKMSLALSLGQERAAAAAWVEGFLYGSGLLLIHNQSLWQILDEWLGSLPAAQFQELLPLLRRSFSQFSRSERQKMLQLAKHPPKVGAQASKESRLEAWPEELEKALLPFLQNILA